MTMCGDGCGLYAESLWYRLKTNIRLHVNYITIKKGEEKRRYTKAISL